MSKAADSTTTRRALFAAGAAALPLSATPAAAAIPAGNPDAELLELGEDFKAAIAEWLAFPEAEGDAAEQDSNEAAQAAYRSVKARDDWKSLGHDIRDQPFHDAMLPAPEPYKSTIEPPDDLYQAIWEIGAEIEKRPPHTIAGLEIHSVLLAFEFRGAWEEPFEDLEWGDRCIRHLVETIRDFRISPAASNPAASPASSWAA